ncbi:MAG TPA: biopolymer transporter ExbD [Candidatus Hydrogenedentes bacterium]|nr:biopolymer transporter ExbD [Candidatus Hydrogenedentota bacterium]HRK36005.1 biopolymer transporter ExbD [Candidatus Hydrogenedentota bacterium]
MKASSKKVMDEINITPLTDIFLVLLIIMMVVAPMLDYRALSVRFSPADAAANSTSDDAKIMSMVVSDNGDIEIEGEITARDRLLQQIKDKAVAFPDGVEVAVSPDASLDAMTAALNAVQSAGIQKVSVTQKSETDEDPASTPAPGT